MKLLPYSGTVSAAFPFGFTAVLRKKGHMVNAKGLARSRMAATLLLRMKDLFRSLSRLPKRIGFGKLAVGKLALQVGLGNTIAFLLLPRPWSRDFQTGIARLLCASGPKRGHLTNKGVFRFSSEGPWQSQQLHASLTRGVTLHA